MRIKKYISYSQMILIEKDPKAYIDRYLYEIETPSNKGQRLGKEISEGIEEGKLTGDIGKDLLISLVPKLELCNEEIKVKTSTGVPILSKIDSISKDYKEFYEHKSGPQGSWSKAKADTWDQITFYCMAIYLKKGFIPKAKLIHIITEVDNGDKVLTGETKEYKTTRTKMDIIKMQVRIKKAWDKIEKVIGDEITSLIK
jgi:hypothetical protein